MDPNPHQLFCWFGIAPVIGVFMGLQRENAYRRQRGKEGELVAGARTFSTIALLGAVSALATTELDSTLLLTGAVLAVGILLSVGHFWQARERDMGLTTVMAALVAFSRGPFATGNTCDSRRLLGGTASLLHYGYLYHVQPTEKHNEPQMVRNPFRLAPAISFGVLYAVFLGVSNCAQSYFGNARVYLSSVGAGLADVDAITLSIARRHEEGDLSGPMATQAILIAAASNTLLKGGIVAVTGTRGLRRAVPPL